MRIFFLRIARYEFAEKKYEEFFLPEIKPFLTEELIQKFCIRNPLLKKEEFIQKVKEEVPLDFYEKRRKGENENRLGQLIRMNDAKELGIYISRNNLSFNSYIPESIFETNPILQLCNPFNIIKGITLLECASFYGSNYVIRFIEKNGDVELTSRMWKFAIHSQNVELIQYLEDKQSSHPSFTNIEEILEESIKCHHNDISDYIIKCFISETDFQYEFETNKSRILYGPAVNYSNYYFFPENMKFKNMLFFLCRFDYLNDTALMRAAWKGPVETVQLLLAKEEIDINAQNI